MIVYQANNILNNSKYIGITKRTLAKRKSDHKYDALVRGKKSKFHYAIRLYGFENFSWSILHRSNNVKNLKRKEREFIKRFNTIDEGYNSRITG